jgi:glutathione S-transferase
VNRNSQRSRASNPATSASIPSRRRRGGLEGHLRPLAAPRESRRAVGSRPTLDLRVRSPQKCPRASPGKARATVPVLVDGDRVLSESWDIAVHADLTGHGTALIPADKESAIRRWESVADLAMQGGRALVLAGMLATPAALDEGSPRLVPRWLRPALRPVARRVMQTFARKYDVRLDVHAGPVAAVRAGLDELRVGLSSGAFYLLGSFSYADVVMATLLQGVVPVADRFIRLGAGTRRAWTQLRIRWPRTTPISSRGGTRCTRSSAGRGSQAPPGRSSTLRGESRCRRHRGSAKR